MKRAAAILLLAALALPGHEGGRKNLKPSQATSDLRLARRKLDEAKKKLAAQGRYNCCVRPACDLCARTTGSCACAVHVAKGLGACGECYGGWQAGRGSLKGVDRKSVKLLPADKQAWPSQEPPPPELKEAADALLRAKRTLVAEKRYFCCIRGGCDQCAHEAGCPCGSDLAGPTPEYYKIAGIQPPKNAAGPKGVCGDCLDGWRSGRGAMAGIPLDDVNLAPMAAMDDVMYTSGTSQAPRAAPMEMLQRRAGGWNLMLHGTLFGLYTDQSGPRGRDKIFGAGWVMPMASRRFGPGTLTLRSMFSPEPALVTNRRYPLLFQTGETAYGIPIISGQHPHDFIMELGASYQVRLGERTLLHFYGGPRGEPALGPTAYPHRQSASENPIAVLSHHYQDSTHISNQVVTAGVTYGPVTLEASGFHGREPDEKRWGLERGGIDSFASRLTLAPASRWLAQFSVGRINNREATHPLRDNFRMTASVQYVRPLRTGHWATTLCWGRSHDLAYTQPPNFDQFFASDPDAPPPVKHIVRVPTRIPGQIYNSYLAESTVFFRNRHWIWGRVENTDKDSLLLQREEPFVFLVEEQRYTRVQAYTVGYERELGRIVPWLANGLGGQLTVFATPDNLKAVYGERPVGVQFFLRFRLAPPAPRQGLRPGDGQVRGSEVVE